MALAQGDPAPDFSLPDDRGRPLALAQLLAEGPLVLFFYPKNETRNCIKEVCSFRDQYEDFTAAGAQVVGISSDPVDSHQAFRSHHRLPFPLLSDDGGKVRERYGVKATLGLLPGRMTFVIDRRGVVQHAFSSQFSPERHITEAIEVVRRL